VQLVVSWVGLPVVAGLAVKALREVEVAAPMGLVGVLWFV